MLNEWQNQVVILLENCCDSLIRTLKYIYAIAEEDYYTVNAKDIFKVALHDITNTAALDNMGLHIQESMPKEFTGEYLKTFRSALLYAFAVRLPYLLTSNNVSKKEMIELYTYLENNGAKPLDLMFDEDFRYFYKRNKSEDPNLLLQLNGFAVGFILLIADCPLLRIKTCFSLVVQMRLFPCFMQHSEKESKH